MPIHSIEPRRLYRQIADQIRALIRSREFAAGARLPPERDLARQLGASRPSVREALVAVVKMLWEERMGPLFAQLEHHYDSPNQWTRAIAEHRLVLDAIGKHDVSGARAAMQGHLDRAYRRFSKSWDAKH